MGAFGPRGCLKLEGNLMKPVNYFLNKKIIIKKKKENAGIPNCTVN